MRIKKSMIVSLVINLLFGIAGGLYIYRKGGVSNAVSFIANSQSVLENPLYQNRDELFKKLPLEHNSIVFLGDSITALNEWAELYHNPKIKNRGIIGDTTTGVFARLDSIVKYHPKQVFLLIGTNDLQNGDRISTIVENYKKIVIKIKTESPQTNIVMQSVLPINPKLYSSHRKNSDIVELNTQLSNLAKTLNITYVDLYSSFEKSGVLDKSYTHDGIHLNGDGYMLWKKLITKYIKI